MIELLSAIAGILLVDLVLSGDNALVIGAAAAGLPQRQRWIAIFFGGAGAAVLRIVFAFIASFLLVLPWLQAIGGLILLIIAIRLLADRDARRPAAFEEQTTPRASGTPDATPGTSRRFLPALLTILVAELMKCLPWLLDVAALVLGWVGANMMLYDLRLGDILDNYPWTAIAVPAVSIGIVLVADVLLRLRAQRLEKTS